MDVHTHDWPNTEATALFMTAVCDIRTKVPYATARGIAFEGRDANDGSWHGFPIPWESVPASIKNAWIACGAVKKRETKVEFNKDDIHWALQTDRR